MRSILCFLALLPLAAAAAAQTNPDCTQSGNHFDCPIRLGQSGYQAVFDQSKPYLVENIRIHNDTSTWYQLQSVTGSSSDPYWGEYSVYLDLFATRQDVPGIGEVGARDWDPFVKSLPIMSWDANFLGRGLTVPPGSTLYLHNNADAMVAAGVQTSTVSYGVTVELLSDGIESFRQPRVDLPIHCNGGNQWTVWNPWPNNDGVAWRVDGATIYAVTPTGSQTDAACVYVLNAAGQIRSTQCAGVNQRGMASFPEQTVQPGESLVAQARHRCNAPGVWDWAAFLHVRR